MGTTKVNDGRIVNGVDMSASFNSTDPAIDANILTISRTSNFVSLEMWTETLTTHVGTIYWDVSNTGDRWFNVGSVAVTSGTAFEDFQDNIQTTAKYLRVRWAVTSGGGDLYVIAHRKEY